MDVSLGGTTQPTKVALFQKGGLSEEGTLWRRPEDTGGLGQGAQHGLMSLLLPYPAVR